jgi:hypothetical protein
MANEWRRYRLSWRLDSPLHIGWRTIGTIMQTRLWVPGRNVWGAMVDVLARLKSPSAPDWQGTQRSVNEALRFEAWFLGTDVNSPWYPKFDGQKGLCYGSMTERELQRLVLGASVSTAIDHSSRTADEDKLFEVEYISPRALHDTQGIQRGDSLFLVGHLWARSKGDVQVFEDDIHIMNMSLREVAASLSIGGERAKGYGRLTCGELGPSVDGKLPDRADSEGNDLAIRIEPNQAFGMLVEALTGEQQSMRGQVEPIVGRDTTSSTGYGQSITSAHFCWLPGSYCTKSVTLTLPAEMPGIATMRAAM